MVRFFACYASNDASIFAKAHALEIISRLNGERMLSDKCMQSSHCNCMLYMSGVHHETNSMHTHLFLSLYIYIYAFNKIQMLFVCLFSNGSVLFK